MDRNAWPISPEYPLRHRKKPGSLIIEQFGGIILFDDDEMEKQALNELFERLENQIQETELSSKSSSSNIQHEKINPTRKEAKNELLQPTDSKSKPIIDNKNSPQIKRKIQLEDMYDQLEQHDIENLKLMGDNEGKDT